MKMKKLAGALPMLLLAASWVHAGSMESFESQKAISGVSFGEGLTLKPEQKGSKTVTGVLEKIRKNSTALSLQVKAARKRQSLSRAQASVRNAQMDIPLPAIPQKSADKKAGLAGLLLAGIAALLGALFLPREALANEPPSGDGTGTVTGSTDTPKCLPPACGGGGGSGSTPAPQPSTGTPSMPLPTGQRPVPSGTPMPR